MSTLADLNTRALHVLSDPSGARYNADLLSEAFLQALELLNRRMPRLARLDLTITDPGRDQPLAGMEHCLFIVSVCLVVPDQLTRELQPDSEFTFQLIEGLPALHFSGARIPQGNDALQITYAQAYTLEDLDAGTFPPLYETALVNGAAGQADLLRAHQLIETYGARSDDAPRLLELGRLRLADFESLLSTLRTSQDFGYPPGFALDKFDRNGSGRYS